MAAAELSTIPEHFWGVISSSAALGEGNIDFLWLQPCSLEGTDHTSDPSGLGEVSLSMAGGLEPHLQGSLQLKPFCDSGIFAAEKESRHESTSPPAPDIMSHISGTVS